MAQEMLPVYRGLQICIVKYSTPNSLVREKFVIFFLHFQVLPWLEKIFFQTPDTNIQETYSSWAFSCKFRL